MRQVGRDHHFALLTTGKTNLRTAASHQPDLVDLSVSSEVIDAVDVILGLHRPDVYDRRSARPGEADLEMLKNKHGPPGHRCGLLYQGPFPLTEHSQGDGVWIFP